jgi:hypothetical protein
MTIAILYSERGIDAETITLRYKGATYRVVLNSRYRTANLSELDPRSGISIAARQRNWSELSVDVTIGQLLKQALVDWGIKFPPEETR